LTSDDRISEDVPGSSTKNTHVSHLERDSDVEQGFSLRFGGPHRARIGARTRLLREWILELSIAARAVERRIESVQTLSAERAAGFGTVVANGEEVSPTRSWQSCGTGKSQRCGRISVTSRRWSSSVYCKTPV